ncbi:MAG: hypothetical protein HGA65_07670 [Oscillochloris sp.]|nr:hypothetical protein [Oscillochloris sp.]
MRHGKQIRLGASLLVAALVVGGLVLALVQAPQGAAQEQPPHITYPEFPPTPTMGPNPTAPVVLASTQTLASSTFDDARALAAWQAVDLSDVLADQAANWEVTDGRLVQAFAGRIRNPSSQETAILTGRPDWADYTISVSFYDQFNGTAGLVAYYSGTAPSFASYYRLRVLKDTFTVTPRLVLEKVVEGVATPLAQRDGPGFSERTWHTLALTIRSGSLTGTLDGSVILAAQDPAPLATGQAGIYTRASGGILFDDALVTTP